MDKEFKRKLQEDRLIRAVEEGNLPTVKELINNGTNVNIFGSYGYTPLMYSIWRNHIDIMKLLIESGADIHFVNKWGDSLLHFALHEKNNEAAKLLISAGVDINATDCRKTTPLVVAVTDENIELAKVIINAGADINIVDSQNSTALFYSSTKTKMNEITKLLIEMGAPLNAYSRWKSTPMQRIVLNNDPEMLDYLVNVLKKQDTNISDGNGQTLLHTASAYNNIYIAKRLIKAGVNINAETHEYKETALHLAGDSACINMMRLLIKAGSDINKRNNSEKTPLDLLKDRNERKYNEYKEELRALYTQTQAKRLQLEDKSCCVNTGFEFDI